MNTSLARGLRICVCHMGLIREFKVPLQFKTCTSECLTLSRGNDNKFITLKIRTHPLPPVSSLPLFIPLIYSACPLLTMFLCVCSAQTCTSIQGDTGVVMVDHCVCPSFPGSSIFSRTRCSDSELENRKDYWKVEKKLSAR